MPLALPRYVLPRFAVAGRRRPVDLVVPGSSLSEVVAPYAAVSGPGPHLELASGTDRLVGRFDGSAAWLEVTTGGATTRHRSRRHARTNGPVRELGLALTGTHLSVLTRGPGPWTVHARVDLQDRINTRDEGWLAGLTSDAPVAGRFGQLGLRDLRLVSGPAAGPPDGPVLLSATSAGPGFFDTAHTSLWELDPRTLGLTHVSDLFFRRPDRPGALEVGDVADQIGHGDVEATAAGQTELGIRLEPDRSQARVAAVEVAVGDDAALAPLDDNPVADAHGLAPFSRYETAPGQRLQNLVRLEHTRDAGAGLSGNPIAI